ncbi:MAG: hypothetical protein PHU21_09720 [Elusimicrobia bacterium]|nr:hypothetical protein [Elusimicrobiota bacterium]
MTRMGWLLVLGVALAARLALWLNLASQPRFLLRPDSPGYLQPAQNLVRHGVYSASESPPWLPDAAHPPGYPAFLAAHLLVSESLLAPAASQVILDAGTAALVSVAAASLSSHPAAWLVGLLYALDPVALAHSPLILSEALCTFLLTLALLLLLRAGAEPTRGVLVACAGLCLGAATSVRPVLLYLWLPWSLALLWAYPGRRKRFAGYFAAGALLLIGAWCLRNRAIWGDFRYNPVRSDYTLLWEAAAVQSAVDRQPVEAARQKLYEEVHRRQALRGVDEIAGTRVAQEVALEVLRAHPWPALRLFPVSMVKMFWGPGLDVVAEVLWPGASFVRTESAVASLAGRGTLSMLKERPCLWLALAWGLLVLTLLYGLAALGLWRVWQGRQRFAAAACLVPVVYLALISSGGWVYYRHRILILPLLAVFGAIALGKPAPHDR